jgi:hypothetical protein
MKRSLIRVSAVALGVGLGFLARSAGAQAADVREVETVQKGPNRALLTSGVVMFGGPYVASVVAATASGRKGDNALYVPVAGPWMDLGTRSCPPDASSCPNEGLYKGLLIADGIFQGLGALQIVGALLWPEKETMTTARTARPRVAAAPKPRFRISPTVGAASGYGVLAIGAF